MSRIHHLTYRLIAMLFVALPALTPRTVAAQEVSPPSVMQESSDSVTTPKVAPAISNMPSIRRRLEDAATSLVTADETLLGTERSVRVRVYVAADGSTDSVRVHASSGNIAVDSVALSIVRTARFTPGTQAGVPVRAVVVLPLRFVFPDD